MVEKYNTIEIEMSNLGRDIFNHLKWNQPYNHNIFKFEF